MWRRCPTYSEKRKRRLELPRTSSVTLSATASSAPPWKTGILHYTVCVCVCAVVYRMCVSRCVIQAICVIIETGSLAHIGHIWHEGQHGSAVVVCIVV